MEGIRYSPDLPKKVVQPLAVIKYNTADFPWFAQNFFNSYPFGSYEAQWPKM